MDARPRFGELRSPSHDTLRSGLPSPRIEHFDGEIPPTLSPLDAFAAQGRLLAKQLEESARRDRRMSRLPPASVARSLSQPRPGYFRSPSSNDSSRSGRGNDLTRQPTLKANPELEEPKFRPQSEHPRLSGVPNFANGDAPHDDANRTLENEPQVVSSEEDFLEATQTGSSQEDTAKGVVPEAPTRFYAASPPSMALTGSPGNSLTDAASSRLNIPRGLAPPVSPRSRPSSSNRALQPESSDDDYSSSTAGSTFSKPRKLSSCSATSLPQSPMTSMNRSHRRSPSLNSEASNNGGHPPRPSYNFSRPLSRSSTSLSAPVPTGTSEQTQGTKPRGSKPQPIVVPSVADMAKSMREEPSSAVSYTYAKYPLPRGRQVSRDSVVFSGLHTPHFEWQEPLFESPDQLSATGPPRSSRTPSPPPSRHSVSSKKARSMYDSPAFGRQLLTPEMLPSAPQVPASPEARRSSEAASTDQPVLGEPALSSSPTPSSAPAPEAPTNEEATDVTSSADSASTVRPQTAKTNASSAVITADEHVTKGIECHEKGSLQESTYHLRVAAKQDHPTGMLLYALACRHGWGMRPNQQEGVRWLRKAVDSVGLELMDDSNPAMPSRVRELQKAYRAQFALSIYELGVSHLNGWGIEQDKSLALRCFEVAGQWGDTDALVEAGYCYSEGIGCKKDLKKAAKFYRQAEAKGVNMVGNSWIHKDKYLSDENPNTGSRGRGRHGGTPDKKQRSKSRTRSLFHRKKSTAAEA
ncbi:hypothetical protein BDV35DRAFT_31884 [Aspergillus flavus]|uniref:Cell cycle inhibitor Nif1 n=2 Tax=Aspergillus subgen. Circumdati TaxID=2720871 RepID=A0A364MPP1_ASPFL|nr:cell cycle inhibitor Nif1, putative [Aspergillus oryzae 3.042]KAB8242228.1 hypothetical protein BDV35DRAFT_31884 [Aspergillus flavus]KDE81516.1 cell cycle inhibitor Nif1, putative [Aspergillus oryzae 100-8]KAJ1714838.1 cell cycle inhibitor Nif1 [Aspergillus flavus]QMW38158.1 hypothetical protein G4B11_001394 [Aspergillus flavus]|eukprot:EIT80086.1 cell cycle inhibitor Nif1, putative [Aspergillus oryzae 3.042]